ncbi:Spo0E like sporulation regulatory protein [Caloranaerobacter azorensis DSM 13643]|uniref:Spo0E like sporulation regulatory protein n=1 Tax=Caloranaerobacter azorensis DSM 13643 TaxID=1121264 RepID=A0A1M5S025_9FIRM|nr:aspartyl-phosphate phosphatase Spo0E family protein [Caloranaerobacter azorensis]SHH31947.1 Spo0E like sporulation regulatory protein [Caloranaerobacter azorensis DSM 13643]
MDYNINREELKNMIEEKRKELNELLSKKNIDKNRALKLSIQLDELIYKYYCIDEDKNR